MQKEVQSKLVALIGYVPDFDQYKNTQIQKEIAFYEPVDNVDNAFARWFLNDPKFTELEELQYPKWIQIGEREMTEVEYGGIKVGGSKLLLIIPLIGTLGGGLQVVLSFTKTIWI